MPSNQQAFITSQVSVQLIEQQWQIKVSLVKATGHNVLNFSHLPAFHLQSSPPIYVIDGSGLWITKHCKLKPKERRELSFWSSPPISDQNTQDIWNSSTDPGNILFYSCTLTPLRLPHALLRGHTDFSPQQIQFFSSSFSTTRKWKEHKRHAALSECAGGFLTPLSLTEGGTSPLTTMEIMSNLARAVPGPYLEMLPTSVWLSKLYGASFDLPHHPCPLILSHLVPTCQAPTKQFPRGSSHLAKR